MTDTPFIDHRLIKKTREMTPATDSLQLIKGISPISLLHVINDYESDDLMGYLVTPCDRVALRLVASEEGAKLGRDVLALDEATALIDRVSRLGELEQAAIDAQTVYVRIRRAFWLAAEHIIKGAPLNKKDLQLIGALHHELNVTDAENAEAERLSREANDKFLRDRVAGNKAAAAKFGLRIKA